MEVSGGNKFKAVFSTWIFFSIIMLFNYGITDKGFLDSLALAGFTGGIVTLPFLFVTVPILGKIFQKMEYAKNEKKGKEKSMREEEERHQITVRRERDILEARADVQINTMQRLHAQNVNVERQLMELRKELQSIENEENRAFMEDMIRKAENSLRR